MKKTFLKHDYKNKKHIEIGRQRFLLGDVVNDVLQQLKKLFGGANKHLKLFY